MYGVAFKDYWQLKHKEYLDRVKSDKGFKNLLLNSAQKNQGLRSNSVETYQNVPDAHKWYNPDKLLDKALTPFQQNSKAYQMRLLDAIETAEED